MALKDRWINKINHVDKILADDVNLLAEEIINTQNSMPGQGELENKLDYKEIYSEEIDDISIIEQAVYYDISLYYSDGYENAPFGMGIIFTATDGGGTKGYSQIGISFDTETQGTTYKRTLTADTGGSYTPSEVGWKAFPEFAAKKEVPISLIGITTSDTDAKVISDNKIDCGLVNTTFIDIQGDVEFAFTHSSNAFDVYVDEEKIYYFDGNNMSFVGSTEYSGIINKGITIKFTGGGNTITFTKFNKIEYVGGFMSPEQAKKLENTYTKEEVNETIGDIETALDTIIEIQNTLIGGESA